MSDFALVIGNPARLSGWMCRCGVKLRVSGPRTRCSCGTSYTLHGDTLALA